MSSNAVESILLDHQRDAGSAGQEIAVQESQPVLPRWRAAMVILVVSLMTLLSTVLSGILAVALPKTAEDIGIDDGLLLWPASVYSLSCACTLLFFGNLADVVGAPWILAIVRVSGLALRLRS